MRGLRIPGAKRLVEVTLADGTTRELRGTNVIISTGTRAALELIPGIVDAQPLTHVEALELDEPPEHLVVVGSGYIGSRPDEATGAEDELRSGLTAIFEIHVIQA